MALRDILGHRPRPRRGFLLGSGRTPFCLGRCRQHGLAATVRDRLCEAGHRVMLADYADCSPTNCRIKAVAMSWRRLFSSWLTDSAPVTPIELASQQIAALARVATQAADRRSEALGHHLRCPAVIRDGRNIRSRWWRYMGFCARARQRDATALAAPARFAGNPGGE